MSSREEIKKEVTSAHELMLDMVQQREVARLGQMLTDEFFCVTHLGSTLTRGDYLNWVSTQRLDVGHLEIESIDVVPYANSAVLHSIGGFHGEVEGLKFVGPIRVTATWIRGSDGWLCAHFHVSDLRKQAAWDGLFKKSSS